MWGRRRSSRCGASPCPAFGPSAIWSVGAGAVLPVVALSARDLGASVGLGRPLRRHHDAGGVRRGRPRRRARRADRRTAGARARRRSPTPPAARWPSWRRRCGCSRWRCCSSGRRGRCSSSPGRATSPRRRRWPCGPGRCRPSGGVTRIGLFLGPLVGAPVVARWGPQAAFGVAVVAGLLAAAPRVALGRPRGAPRVGGRPPARAGAPASSREHRRVLLTVGLGVLAIGLARSSRVVVVPLWAEHVGLDAAQTSLVFAAAAFVEVVLFWPAGTVMDRHGRVWVAVPVSVLLGLGLLVLPAHDDPRRRRRARPPHGRGQRARLRHRHDPRCGCRAGSRARALPRGVAPALARRPQRRLARRRRGGRRGVDRGGQRGGRGAHPGGRRVARPVAPGVRPAPARSPSAHRT